MKVVPKSPSGHSLGWCIFRSAGAPPGGTGMSVSFFVRGRFALPPGGAATIDVSQSVVPTGDTPHDDASRGLRYPSDFVPRKPFGEVIVVGTAHPPAGGFAVTRYPVRVTVGGWSKQIDVSGERTWDTSGLFDKPGPATQAGPLPLSFAHAWGGPQVAANPLGCGAEGAKVPSQEPGGRPIAGRQSGNEPACLGPIPAEWPQRKQHAGMPGAGGLRSWWPWSPPRFDERYWMATPPDQWVEGYFRGDEPVELVQLHPEQSNWRITLPGQRARVFVLRIMDEVPLSSARRGRLTDVPARFEEVPLVLDTVHIDTDAEKMTLVWRGSTPVRSPKLLDILGVSFGLEPLEEHRDPEWYCAALFAEEQHATTEPPPDAAAIRAEIEAAIAERQSAQAAVEAEMESQFAKAKADVAAELAKVRVGHDEAVGQMVAAFEPHREAEIRAASSVLPHDLFDDVHPPASPSMLEVAADLRRQADSMMAPPSGCPDSMTGAFLVGARERAEAVRQAAAGLEEAAGLEAGFMDRLAAFKGELLAAFPPQMSAERTVRPGDALDLEKIRRYGLAEHDVRGVDFSGLDLGGVSFRGVSAAGARFSRSRLAGADFTGADLSGADLTGADLSGAVLEQTDLTGAIVADARFSGARIGGANLRGLALAAADFSDAIGRYADFSGADLSAAVFRGARLEQPAFTAVRAAGADFSESVLTKAGFGGAVCHGAVFDDASLPNLRAREGADFTGARLRRLKADDASWTTSILDRADFQDADLRRSDFSECSLDGTNLDRCDLANAVFADSTIQSAVLTDANLLRASFDRATLVDVRFDGSSLFEAGFWDASLAGATFKGCDVSRASLPTGS